MSSCGGERLGVASGNYKQYFFKRGAGIADLITEKLRFGAPRMRAGKDCLRRYSKHGDAIIFDTVILSRAKHPRKNVRMPPTRRAWVYMLASRKNGTLYVGVTTTLRTRVWQHQASIIDGFTKQYRITTLVHFEEFRDVRDAIAREKEIKGWSRGRKVWLIESTNPDWGDLARCWADDGLDPSQGSG